MRSLIRRSIRRSAPSPPPRIPAELGPSVLVAHPAWRGIRRTVEATGMPVVLAADLGVEPDRTAATLRDGGSRVAIVHGFPSGVAAFAEAATRADVETRVVFHSSMAQQGAEAGELDAVLEAYALVDRGLVSRVGFAKEGQAEAYRALGRGATYVPPRALAETPRPVRSVGDAPYAVGIFGPAAWRKNVFTQIGAAAMVGARAHTIERPVGAAAAGEHLVVHGEVTDEEYPDLLASMDAVCNVSLYECFPVLPQEAVLLGIPCLVSRTSALFADDGWLWDNIAVSEHDNPTRIAAALRPLLEDPDHRSEAVHRARTWMTEWNETTQDAWAEFHTP